MKKSTRILSLLMALMMLLGTFSVLGSAYQEYKGTAVNFDDIDAATFTTEQYASMGLDEVDRMLAEEQLSVYIYIGTLDVTSIDNAVASVESLLDSVSALLAMLDDAKNLSIESLRGKRRTGTYSVDADLEIVYSIFDFLYDNAGILENYANGTLNLGILDSFVAEYVFNVRELLTGLVFGATEAGKAIDYDYFDNGTTGIPAAYLDADNGILNLLQGLVNDLVLGTWQKLDTYFDDPYDDHEEVTPAFYAFEDAGGNDVSGEAINTKTYDYYGWVHPDNWVTVGLGGAKRVAEGAVAPAADYELLDITGDVLAYDFIEALLQRAYNYVLVPVLNRDTAPWLKEECGYEFPDKYTEKQIFDETKGELVNNPDYVENYPGIAPEGIEDNVLYKLFKTEDLVISKFNVPAGTTLISNLNDILGSFVSQICKYPAGTSVAFEGGNYSWNWTYGSNSYLFSNICNVARFVLELTGDAFFGSTIKTMSAADIKKLNDQQTVAYVLRAILNSSIDWMYIDDNQQTVAEVGYAAVEQLAWQYIPQITYTKPTKTGTMTDAAYYDALVEKALTILLDVAAYKLNQDIDMNSASGADPKNSAGLIPYQGDSGSYVNNVIMVAEWAVQTYGKALALNLNLASSGSHSESDLWNDLDTILNGLVPFKGTESILASSISGNTYVFKSLVFENILKPVINLNAENFVKIFDKNETGILATSNGIEVIMTVLNKVFDLLFPDVFKKGVSTIDGLLVNTTLGTMIYDLASEFGRKAATRTGKTNGVALTSRTIDLVYVALPIVCQALGLSDDQEFGELECYMPGTISASSAKTEFLIYNGSSGINTGYTSAAGVLTKDQSYTYEISQIYANGYKNGVKSDLKVTNASNSIAGGKSSTVTLSGYSEGMVIAFYVVYNVKDETGANMTTSALTNTSYAYVGSASKDDDSITKEITVGSRKIKYESEIYISTGASLSKVANYSLRFVDSEENKSVDNPGVTGTVTVTNVTVNNETYPFATKNTNASTNTTSFIGKGGTYFVNPFEIAKKADETEYVRYADVYETDADGKYVLDGEGNKQLVPGGNGGVPAGKYVITTTLNVAGTSQNVTTTVHIYDDYGLDGAFDRAVSTNRQSSNYDHTKNNDAAAGLWNTYDEAIKNAATIALRPKTGSTFENDIAYAGSDYDNLYQKYAAELQAAIDALKPYELSSGTSAIESAIREYSGFNYDIVTVEDYQYKVYRDWTDSNYIYFGYEDFVPHTYNRYKAARNEALDLIDSQHYYLSSDILIKDTESGNYIINPNASDKVKAKNAAEKVAADAFVAPIINAVSAEYAIHMVKFMGKRLISLNADKSKLNKVLAFAVKDSTASYTKDSLDAFTKARTFAEAVAADSSSTLKPSKVKTAMNNLVEAWKELAIGADYTNLDAALDDSAVKAAIAVGIPGEQVVYSESTFAAFYAAYQTATALKAAGLSNSTENQAKIDAAATDLIAKCGALAAAGSEGVSFSLDTTVKFYTTAYENANTLKIDDSLITDWYEPPVFKGVKANHLVFGFGEFYTEDEVLAAFKNIQNGTVEVQTSPNGDYGNGTIVIIKDSSGEIYDTYMMVLRGDVDGNGLIENSDEYEDLKYYNGIGAFDEFDSATSGYFFGADTDGDGFVDVTDCDLICKFYNGVVDIGQTNGGAIVIPN